MIEVLGIVYIIMVLRLALTNYYDTKSIEILLMKCARNKLLIIIITACYYLNLKIYIFVYL